MIITVAKSGTSTTTGILLGEPTYLTSPRVVLPGGSSNYRIFEQLTPMATWTISHEFLRPPDVTVITSEGFVILTDIEYPNDAMVVITFAQPTTGRALLV